MSDPVDADIQAATNGDADALRRLLERLGPRLRQNLNAAIGPKWAGMLDADDVLQVTYLEAFLQIGSLNARDEPAFLGWLTRMAHNNLRDAIRELGRHKRPPPDRRVQTGGGEESYIELLEMLGTSSATPSRQAARAEAAEIIEQSLAVLPSDYRNAVRMYDLQGLSAAEAAAAMGRSIGAFHMLRTRAHSRLKSLVGGAARFFTDAG